MDWCLNSTFITLIPKKADLNIINNYRPIVWLSGIYKLVVKVLSVMLRPLMSSLVSDHQGVGVIGRQIHDIGMIANELVDYRRASKKLGLLFKLNFFKAVDCISWNIWKEC